MKHDTLKTICLSMLCVLGLGSLQAQTWDGTTIAANYAGGDGTKENPFLISNGAELAKLAQDVMAEKDFSLGRYFKLTADIVLNENVNQTAATTLESGNAFPASPVIGAFASETEYTAFQGVLDGDGHTISGLYLTFAQDITNYLALFRVTEDAEIRNLGIQDSYVYAGAYLSNLVGRAINTRIINCFVVGSTVKGWGSNSAPLVAQAMGTTKIQNCYTQCTVAVKNDAGAIVGRIGNGDVNEVIVENCYTTSSVTTNTSA